MFNSLTPITNRRGLSVFTFMLSIYFLSLLLQTIYYPLRYTKYVLPFIAIIDFIAFRSSRKLHTHILREYLQPNLAIDFFLIFCSFISCFIAGYFKSDRLYVRFFQESFFILAPLLFILVTYFYYVPSKKEQYAKYAFWSLIFVYLVEEGFNIISIITNPSLLYLAVTQSNLSTESGHAFTIGLFFLYFTFRGEKLYSILSLFFTILSYKRVVLLSLFITTPLYFLLSKINFKIYRYQNLISISSMIINFLLVLIIIQLANGTYDEIITDYTGLSTDALLMGRQQLYAQVLKTLGNYSWFGTGLGSTMVAIVESQKFVASLINVHSDLLKNFLEFGSVLYLIWSFFLYRLNTRTIEMFVITIYLNIIFLTDNVFIYFDVMFIFYLLQSFFVTESVLKR